MHAVAVVFDKFQRAGFGRKETGPAAAAVEFGIAAKQCHTADQVHVSARAMLVQIRPGTGQLGATVEGDLLLLFGKQMKAQPLPEFFGITGITSKSGDFFAPFEQDNGGCGHQCFGQYPAGGRLLRARLHIGHRCRPMLEYVGLEAFAIRAVFGFVHHQLPCSVQLAGIQRRRGHTRTALAKRHTGAAQAAIAIGVFQ